MGHGDEDLATVVDAKARKVSTKALEERLQCAVSTGKAKLSKLTGKMKQIHQATDESGDGCLTVIQTKMVEFNKLFGKFCDLNISIIFHQISEEGMIRDQANWLNLRVMDLKILQKRLRH